MTMLKTLLIAVVYVTYICVCVAASNLMSRNLSLNL